MRGKECYSAIRRPAVWLCYCSRCTPHSWYILLHSSLSLSSPDIPDNQKNACVSVNETDNVTYTCTSEEFPILWRVGSRQIRDTAGLSSNGIIVTTSSDSEGYNSAIVFTEEGIDFLAGMVGDMEIEVVCLVERDVFDIVEGDIRTFLIYSESYWHWNSSS